MIKVKGPLFELGQIVSTPGAIALMEKVRANASELLNRHVAGDFGDCCPEDLEANEQAVENEERVFSVYKLIEDQTVWIITEADRSSTCILLPSEY